MSGRTLARYTVVATLVITPGAALTFREFVASSDAEGPRPGVVDTRSRLALGEPAADSVLEDARTGDMVALSDFRGSTVVLNFWATWCLPCCAEMPEFEQTYRARLADADLVILAVDFREGASLVQLFIDEFDLSFPVVLGWDRIRA